MPTARINDFQLSSSAQADDPVAGGISMEI
jgi:hypothetical protein